MKKALLYIIWLVSGFAVLAQQVSNTRFEQDGKQVKIYYDLSEKADVSIYLSTDGGNTYEPTPIEHVSGHVGPQVAAGKSRCAVWDVLSDRDKLQSNQIRFKIKAVNQRITFNVCGVKFNLVYVEGGNFTMGCTSEQDGECRDDEKPAHSVSLSDYYIGETEVTQALWKAVMGSNPSYFKGNNLPVEDVSWENAQTFIRKLNQMTGLSFRLPTEAEWEYAARGGKKSRGFKYSGSNTLDEVAWYNENGEAKTHVVKGKRANELGIYDMSGNIEEWCSDWSGSYSGRFQQNPQGPSTGLYRVYRGGSFCHFAEGCRVSFRITSEDISPTHGIRLVLSL